MPLDQNELLELDINSWKDIHKEFEHSDLFLGNGFSLNFSDVFFYGSLFEKFLKQIPGDKKSLLNNLDTTNFEAIQLILMHAKRINELLAYPIEKIEELLKILREGLVKVIRDNHPQASETDKKKLEGISEKLDIFKNIYTTNYDLYLYHIIMISKDRYRENNSIQPYNDYFWLKLNSHLEFMDYQEYKFYKHIYYLHGALFLFSGELLNHHTDLKLKLRRGQDWELIDEIARMINTNHLPLFVSEGSSEQKLRAISRSPYLMFAFSKFKECSESLVIYGSSFSEQDQHIVSALDRKKRNIAVSLFIGDKKGGNLKKEMSDIRSQLTRHDVVFFDSSTLFLI